MLETAAGEVLSRGEYTRILGHRETIGDLLELWRIASDRAVIHDGHATMQIRIGARSLFMISPARDSAKEIVRMARLLTLLTG
jgi:hypothetical protein